MNKIERLLINGGLYDSVDITIDDLGELKNILFKIHMVKIR